MVAVALLLFMGSCQKDPIGGGQGTVNYSEKTAQEGGYTYSYVEGDPMQVRQYTLENGLKILLSVNKNKPRIQTYVAVAAGSKNDPAHATGLAHYLEHMVFKGTSKLGTADWAKEKPLLDSIENLFTTYRQTTDPAKRKAVYAVIDKVSGEAAKYAIANEYDKLMTHIGATGTNAYTWLDQTVYVNDIPSNNLQKWALVEAERFGEMVPRLFHTELEAVYEEKNRSLDDDGSKVFEGMFKALFPNHTYGSQTTIGTVEHLKNPSITEIKKFFDTYYVPNNMAVCMSGDLDPTETVKIIEKTFGKLKRKELPAFSQPALPELKKTELTYTGPSQESVSVAWRIPGFGTKEARLATLMGQLLSNGAAGIMDLNLVSQQKVLGASAASYVFKEYGVLFADGQPREGQKLEEVRDLMLAQIDSIKQGRFDKKLLQAVINNLRQEKMYKLEENEMRASTMVDVYVNGGKWIDAVQELELMAKVTPEDIIAFAKANFNDNYVVAYKRLGVDNSIEKVVKPAITPVAVNREMQSTFLKDIMAMEATRLKPDFVNLDKEITTTKLDNGLEVQAVKNKMNTLGTLELVWPMGNDANPAYDMATSYASYLGSKTMTADDLNKELFALGLSWSIASGDKKVVLSISGLDENLDKGLALVEGIMADLQPDEAKLANLKQDLIKALQDQKLNKGHVLGVALRAYALFGANSPFLKQLKPKDIETMSSGQLIGLLKELPGITHKVQYYGPRSVEQVASMVAAAHKVAGMKPAPVNAEPVYNALDKPAVLMAHYDMVQADLAFISHAGAFSPDIMGINSMYNNYFDGNMGSIVFQELRESKALAYSCYSRLNRPKFKARPMFNVAGIGCQADKLAEAMAGMTQLLDAMPQNPQGFETAKKALIEQMESQRYSPREYFTLKEEAQDLGLPANIEETLYKTVPGITLQQVADYQKQRVAAKPRVVTIIGHRGKLNKAVLAKYGTLRELSLEELYGY